MYRIFYLIIWLISWILTYHNFLSNEDIKTQLYQNNITTNLTGKTIKWVLSNNSTQLSDNNINIKNNELDNKKNLDDIIIWKGNINETYKLLIERNIKEINKLMNININEYLNHIVVITDEKEEWSWNTKRAFTSWLKGSKNNKWTIYISAYKFTDNFEFWNVLTHEMWHIVDLFVLQWTWDYNTQYYEFNIWDKVFLNWDKSFDFYDISWSNNTEYKGNNNFVSWYWKTNPFEDFAETFNLYINHNSYLLTLWTQSDAIAKKYEFMYNLMNWKYIYEGSYNWEKVYDTTLLKK